MTFTLIRTYKANATTGFVYELNGRRCASLARSLDSLKGRLGVSSLPALTGTDKQIAWASDLRAAVLGRVSTLVVEAKAEYAADADTLAEIGFMGLVCKRAAERMAYRDSAGWWIDRRSEWPGSFGGDCLAELERCYTIMTDWASAEELVRKGIVTETEATF